MVDTKLQKMSKGLRGAKLSDLQRGGLAGGTGTEVLSGSRLISSISWGDLQGDCCDLGFCGWRLGTICHRLRVLCFHLPREEPFWVEISWAEHWIGEEVEAPVESPTSVSLQALVCHG
jgi:hypothetical protein